ncbi:MAG: hypothetical protein PHQ93_01705 [Sulfurimonas sp.]|uniref:hypothetical protein n=1 Tax=Sulfurimonas sp. TaxID=2022749 RepID=UPI00262A2BBE|nr:hypothetical protein [Sulfurimonas sp.]MDD5399890.1 hypothetical protein [Sulfurimonas sp.]
MLHFVRNDEMEGLPCLSLRGFSRGNLNDGEQERDCFTAFAMTGWRDCRASLAMTRGGCNDERGL